MAAAQPARSTHRTPRQGFRMHFGPRRIRFADGLRELNAISNDGTPRRQPFWPRVSLNCVIYAAAWPGRLQVIGEGCDARARCRLS